MGNLKKKLVGWASRWAVGAVAIMSLSGCASGAVYYARGPIPPPPPRAYYRGVAPGPGYVWRGGYYNYGPRGYIWVGPSWVMPPRRGAIWIAPRWYGRNWRPGYWR
jgi:hypothetical protein